MRRSITFVAVAVAVLCAGSGCATIAQMDNGSSSKHVPNQDHRGGNAELAE